MFQYILKPVANGVYFWLKEPFTIWNVWLTQTEELAKHKAKG